MIGRAAYMALASLLAATLAAADAPRGPVLGAASNFGQSWQRQAANGGSALGVTLFRDEVIWNKVEQEDGGLVFGSTREAYPAVLSARGADMLLLAYTGHPNWEDGHVPQGPEGQAAFARYQTQILTKFPKISTLEIGNEFNSEHFAETEDWPADLQSRAQTYVRLLATTAAAVRAVHPEVKILGGAAHSIPVAWAKAVVAAGGLAHMDAFVLHPYTTPPEHLARQIARLRQVPGMADIPIAVTEFGQIDETAAPEYLLKMYCQMAVSGVTHAIWYPFSPRGDGLAPLVTKDGTPTAVGEAYAQIRARFEGRPVQDVSPDPFTYAYRFGARALVLWGAPRQVALADGLRAIDARGAVMNAPLSLSRDAPLVILSEDAPVSLGGTVRLGPQRVLADSYDQFSYRPDSPIPFMVRRGASDLQLEHRPGQDRGGVPWTPYLGFDRDGTVMVGPDRAVPSSWGPEDPLSIVYHMDSADSQTVDVHVSVAPSPESEDGVSITLRRNNDILAEARVDQAADLLFDTVLVAAADRLEVILGPNENSRHDHTRWRITVVRAK